MSTLLKVFIIILAVGFLISVFGPRERVDYTISFSETNMDADLDAYLAGSEGKYSDILPGAEKEIIWAGAAGAKTPLSIVYVHGFSATKQEIRPVPDQVAQALGANLYYTRLTGHGRGSEAMGQATANDWLNDMAETLAIGKAIGERVVVISTSTGGTITALSAVDIDQMRGVAGLIFVSPNFGINSPIAPLLNAPFAKQVLPLIFGEERSFEPINAEQEKWWTTRYPSKAVFPLAATVAAAVGMSYEAVTTPAFFIYSPEDEVVKASEIARIASRWPVRSDVLEVEIGVSDDPAKHVIAGDIMSPGMTDVVTARMIDWITSLP